MFSSGIPKYKYVYPTLLFLLMFLLMLLARSLSAGEETPATNPPGDPENAAQTVETDWLYPEWTYFDSPHGEMDFIRAAETFNKAAGFEARLERKTRALDDDRLASVIHRRLDGMDLLGGYEPSGLARAGSRKAVQP